MENVKFWKLWDTTKVQYRLFTSLIGLVWTVTDLGINPLRALVYVF